MYQYGIRVTIELLDGKGGVEDTEVDVRICATEREARLRHEELANHLARPNRFTPKYQRVSGVQLIRRPIGDWEEVQA